MRIRGCPFHLQNLDFTKVFLAKGEVDSQRGQNFPEVRQKPAWRLGMSFGYWTTKRWTWTSSFGIESRLGTILSTRYRRASTSGRIRFPTVRTCGTPDASFLQGPKRLTTLHSRRPQIDWHRKGTPSPRLSRCRRPRLPQ